MKTMIAAVLSLAFANGAYAAVPSAPLGKQASVKAENEIELAAGRSRDHRTSTSGNQNNAPSPSAKKTIF